MATPPHTPAPVPIYLCGSKPGVFDPTQPARLFRHSDSTLLFASFNPLTACGDPSLPADILTGARRVVVEIPHANDFSQRPNWFSFVPNAVLAPGVASEGRWPRVVNYCGQWVVCDQEQWDIHKLDPMYDCFVPAAGMHPTITKKVSVQFPATGAHTRPRKRGLSLEGDQPPPVYASKRARGGAALYPEPGRTDDDCPDVPMGETSPASSTTTAGPASGAPIVYIFSTPVPPTASSAGPSSSTHSSGRPRPRTPDIVDLTMDEDDEHVGEQARAGKEPCTRQTGSEQSAAEDAIAAVLARRQAQAVAAAGSRAHAVRACPDLEGRQRRQEHRQQWMPWTRQRAIDRYLAVSEQFDNTRFSHENPVDLLFIPWPVLRSPFTLLVNEIDWQMVEDFFKEAARQMEIEDYKVFVAESHRRFHPDRWRSRGVFRTREHEVAHTLERACTIVSQALTPIWTASRTG